MEREREREEETCLSAYAAAMYALPHRLCLGRGDARSRTHRLYEGRLIQEVLCGMAREGVCTCSLCNYCRNLALTFLHVPSSLDSGELAAGPTGSPPDGHKETSLIKNTHP